MGTQKNCLTETILLSTHNIEFDGQIKIWRCEILVLSRALIYYNHCPARMDVLQSSCLSDYQNEELVSYIYNKLLAFKIVSCLDCPRYFILIKERHKISHCLIYLFLFNRFVTFCLIQIC